MIVVTLDEVQQWLERTKMLLTTVDPDLAESARLIAFSRLADIYDTTSWAAGNTPKMVRAIISMFVASWEYQRAYGEEEDSTYGRRLERRANDLLDEIVNGNITLEEFPNVTTDLGSPLFYPNDLSNASEVYDAMGFWVDNDDDVKFRMSGSY